MAALSAAQQEAMEELQKKIQMKARLYCTPFFILGRSYLGILISPIDPQCLLSSTARREQSQAYGADGAEEGEGRRVQQRPTRKHGLRPQNDTVRAQETVLIMWRCGM